MSNTPSDAEIRGLAAEGNGVYQDDETAVWEITDPSLIKFARAALAKWGTPQPVVREPLTDREIELIDGMIEVQLRHAQQCDSIPNRRMAERQKSWDIERASLLQKLKAKHGITQKGDSNAE